MSKFISFCFLALFFCANVNAQAFIIERGSAVFSYPNITEAVAALQDDDKLYIPPGVHGASSGTISITKKVHMIGAGYAGGDASIFNGTVRFSASGNTVTGIRFSTLTLQNITNTHFSRCRVTGQTNGSNSGSAILFTECEFQGSFGVNSYLRGVVATKCIFRGSVYVRESVIYNSLIGLNSGSTFPGLNSDDNCIFQNNIFVGSMVNTTTSISLTNVRNTTFNNNLFVGGKPNFSTSHSYYTFTPDNIVEELYSNVFTDPANEDYTLKAACKGKNAGTDGKDLGLFGTSVPFKESRLPSVPYFSLKNIGVEVNEAGNLPVKFVIEAQDR